MYKIYVYETKNPENKELVGTRPTLQKADKFAETMLMRMNYEWNVKIEKE